MPTYSFECSNTDCNFKMDRFVKITYPKLSECPQCHKKTFIRCIGTGGGFILKGDGWTTNRQISNAIKENNKMNKEREQMSKENPDF